LRNEEHDKQQNVDNEAGEMDFMHVWHSIQVKQGDRVGLPDIDAFETAMQRVERKLRFWNKKLKQRTDERRTKAGNPNN
jgi:hypothetical protein